MFIAIFRIIHPENSMALIIAPICGTNKVLHHCILAIDSACPRVGTLSCYLLCNSNWARAHCGLSSLISYITDHEPDCEYLPDAVMASYFLLKAPPTIMGIKDSYLLIWDSTVLSRKHAARYSKIFYLSPSSAHCSCATGHLCPQPRGGVSLLCHSR